MDKSDVEFWNGVSKGVALAIEKLKKIEPQPVLCIDALRELREQVGLIHVKDIQNYIASHLD